MRNLPVLLLRVSDSFLLRSVLVWASFESKIYVISEYTGLFYGHAVDNQDWHTARVGVTIVSISSETWDVSLLPRSSLVIWGQVSLCLAMGSSMILLGCHLLILWGFFFHRFFITFHFRTFLLGPWVISLPFFHTLWLFSVESIQSRGALLYPVRLCITDSWTATQMITCDFEEIAVYALHKIAFLKVFHCVCARHNDFPSWPSLGICLNVCSLFKPPAGIFSH